MNESLPDQLEDRLRQRQPAARAAGRFAPELSYGRHSGPPLATARRAAVLLLLYRKSSGWHFPLMVRSPQLADHPGQICLPGGLAEPGETSAQAALRELSEELGIELPVRLIGRLSKNWVFSTNYWITPWLGVTSARPEWRPNSAEVAEVLEVPMADLIDSTCHDRFLVRRGNITFEAPCLRWQEHRVWGVTSMIVGELLGLLDELAI
jgi:8-oxo-dGTP pyrophosphatase MutT (NUDIX family)